MYSDMIIMDSLFFPLLLPSAVLSFSTVEGPHLLLDVISLLTPSRSSTYLYTEHPTFHEDQISHQFQMAYSNVETYIMQIMLVDSVIDDRKLHS